VHDTESLRTESTMVLTSNVSLSNVAAEAPSMPGEDVLHDTIAEKSARQAKQKQQGFLVGILVGQNATNRRPGMLPNRINGIELTQKPTTHMKIRKAIAVRDEETHGKIRECEDGGRTSMRGMHYISEQAERDGSSQLQCISDLDDTKIEPHR